MQEAQVSVLITTYNLEKYIAQCLDSVLMQKTDFRFNVLVYDDCSTDDTADILKEYQARHPGVVEVMPSLVNLGSLANSNRAFRDLKAKYFSFLDGDDYWLGENRLQEQYDFLEQNDAYVMCGGNTKYIVDNAEADDVITKMVNDFDFQAFMEGKGTFVHTSALLVRNVIFKEGIPDTFVKAVGTSSDCSFRGEDFRFRIHLREGRIRVLDKTLSAYRIHDKGMWQGSSPFTRNYEEARANLDYATFFGAPYFSEHLGRSYKACLRCLSILRNMMLDKNRPPEVSPQQVGDLWEVANQCLTHRESIAAAARADGFVDQALFRIYQFARKKLEKRGLV